MSTTILGLAASTNLGISLEYAVGPSPCQDEKRRTQPSEPLLARMLHDASRPAGDPIA
jgi:hypothetical protein